MPTGGPLESVNIDNVRYPVDGESAAVLSLPGYTNEVKPLGNPGEARIEKSAKTGKFSTIPIVADTSRGDLEVLQAVMNSNSFVSFFATEVNSTVWEGSIMITEEPEYNSKTNIIEVTVMGSIKRQGA
jgi:hypothetical protein